MGRQARLSNGKRMVMTVERAEVSSETFIDDAVKRV